MTDVNAVAGMKPESMMQYMLKEITVQNLESLLNISVKALCQKHTLSCPFTAWFLNIRANLINLPIIVYLFLLYTLEYVEIAKDQKCVWRLVLSRYDAANAQQ